MLIWLIYVGKKGSTKPPGALLLASINFNPSMEVWDAIT